MAEKNSFILRNEYLDIFTDLSDNQAGVLIKAVYKYAAAKEMPEGLKDVEVKMAFKFIKKDIDYDTAKYEELCEKRSEAGKSGGRPKKQMLFEKPKGFFEKQKKHSDSVVDSEVDKSTLKEKEVKEKEKPLASAFDRFLNYRKQIKKPFKSQMSIDECYKRLEKLSGGNLNLAEQIVNQSIAQGWQGLFDLKQGANNAGTGIDFNGKDADLSKYEEFERKNTKVFYSK